MYSEPVVRASCVWCTTAVLPCTHGAAALLLLLCICTQAKWALDAAGVDYSITPYALSPFYVFELPLRWRLGRLTGKITAPIMLLPNSTTSSAGGATVLAACSIIWPLSPKPYVRSLIKPSKHALQFECHASIRHCPLKALYY